MVSDVCLLPLMTHIAMTMVDMGVLASCPYDQSNGCLKEYKSRYHQVFLTVRFANMYAILQATNKESKLHMSASLCLLDKEHILTIRRMHQVNEKL